MKNVNNMTSEKEDELSVDTREVSLESEEKVELAFDEKLKTLMALTYSENIEELSIALGVSKGTIRTWRARNKIPDKVINKANLIFAMGPKDVELDLSKRVTLDSKLSEQAAYEFKNVLMEAIFSAAQKNKISLGSEVKVGEVADIMIEEILEKFPNIFK